MVRRRHSFDASFDAVLTVFGAMFAPDHPRTADEIVRVTRAGGRVGLASWTPDGFIGEMFRTVTSHVPAPPGVLSPLLWGTQEHLADLFGDAVTQTRSVERTVAFRFTSPEDSVALFRPWYGPTVNAFETLDEGGRTALAADLADLARRWDTHRDGGSDALPAPTWRPS